jgi:hypothetical protein
MMFHKSSNMEIFSHLHDYWLEVNQDAFSTVMADEGTAALVTPWKKNLIEFVAAQRDNFQPHDDYRKLLELTIVFLGGVLRRGIHFMYSGAVHRARYISSATKIRTS